MAELAEQLSPREAAMRAIMRAIGEFPDDYAPVFDAIIEHGTRLCEADQGVLLMCEGEHFDLVAERGLSEVMKQFVAEDRMRVDANESLSGQAAVARRVVHVDDVRNHEPTRGHRHRVTGVEYQHIRTQLAVPMLLGDVCIGVISVWRNQIRPFDDSHIDLVQTFAEQAVIAVENTRRFRALDTRTAELTKALERQAATSEVLRVISESPTDTQPVFKAIIERAARICEASTGVLFQVRDEHLYPVSAVGLPEGFNARVAEEPIRVDSKLLMAQAAAQGQVVHVEDVSALSSDDYTTPYRSRIVALGIRTIACVPLRKNGESIGVLWLARREVNAFRDEDIELLKTFADQAVIAIDNSQLFEEVNARTEEARDALSRQTATSEVLRVISASPTDPQPVFEAILEKAAAICDVAQGILFLLRDDALHAVAFLGVSQTVKEIFRKNPLPLDNAEFPAARVAREGEILQIEDLAEWAVSDVSSKIRSASLTEEARACLLVPMLRAEQCVGVVAVFRREKRLFDNDDITVLKAFAGQAVIAIDNARLFKEVNDRTEEVRDALRRQTATSEVLRVISSSPTDAQPVFAAILERAADICDVAEGALFLVEGSTLQPVAFMGVSDAYKAAYQAYAEDSPVSIVDAVTPAAQAVARREIVQVEDLSAFDVGGYGSPLRDASIEEGVRSVLFVPMYRGPEAVGLIAVFRHEVRLFDEEDFDLLSTFADQAVIAIENVRQFQALQRQSAELSRTVGELRALGEVGQAVSSTLDLDTVLNTIIKQAVDLSGATGGVVAEYDEATGLLPIRAAPGFAHLVSGVEPTRYGEGVIGKAASEKQPVHIPDLDAPGAYPGKLRHLLDRAGLKALLAVPLLREDRVLGTLLVGRGSTGEFPQATIDLLETFASQSALAIHNARVYRALEEQGRALDAANRHKSEFLANMSHELRTPLNAVIGFSEVLGDEIFGELNDKQSEYIHDINESGKHLLSLINDILDLSKIEAGHMELDLSRFALAPAIENAVTLVRERASRRGLTLESMVGEDLDEMIGDERKFKQILLNLLSNAIKFTPSGGRVSLAAKRVQNNLQVTVKDTGVGMSEDDQARVFEAFQQAGVDYARKAEGTGLGLTLTRQFAELHGGAVKVQSTVGKGSTFTVVLPLTQANGHGPDG